MKPLLRRLAPLGTMLIFPVLGMIYAVINTNPGDRIYNLVTDLDRGTPFLKVFVLPYAIWIFYIYACLIYFYFKDPKVYYRSLATYTICALVCYMIYLVYQTTVPRPVVAGNDVFSDLIRYVYNRDEPYNCFPSIHVFSSYLVMKALYKSDFRNGINQSLIYGMSTLIICSTLFVKQHVIMDVVAGIFLAEMVYRLVLRNQWFGRTALQKRIAA